MADDDDPIDRATFLRQGWQRLVRGAARGAVTTVDAMTSRVSGTWLRPPGALPEPDFLLACTRCNECATACPHDAIVPLHDHVGPAARTPHILPTRMPCYLCDDLPCIAACADGALVPVPSGPAGVRMGIAELSPHRCLVSRGQVCEICVQCCPFPGVALKIGSDRLPIVDPATCTGCGVCVQVCPVRPAALSVKPIGGNHVGAE